MVTVKCTYNEETFYQKLIDLCEQYPNVHTEGYDSNYFDTKKKGYLKCKGAFAAKKDPFIGVWVNDIPKKGFYSEVGECTLDNLKEYLNNLPDEEFTPNDGQSYLVITFNEGW